MNKFYPQFNILLGNLIGGYNYSCLFKIKYQTYKTTPTPFLSRILYLDESIWWKEKKESKLCYPCGVLCIHDPIPFSFNGAEGFLVIWRTKEKQTVTSQLYYSKWKILKAQNLVPVSVKPGLYQPECPCQEQRRVLFTRGKFGMNESHKP